MRLGQAERAEHLAARERTQPLVLLRIAAPRHQDRADRAVVDADDRRGRAVAGRDLLEDHRQREVVEAGAVPFGRHRDAVAAELREAAQLLGREVALAVPARRVRRDLGLDVGTDRVLHRAVVVRQQHGRWTRLAKRVVSGPRRERELRGERHEQRAAEALDRALDAGRRPPAAQRRDQQHEGREERGALESRTRRRGTGTPASCAAHRRR